MIILTRLTVLYSYQPKHTLEPFPLPIKRMKKISDTATLSRTYIMIKPVENRWVLGLILTWRLILST